MSQSERRTHSSDRRRFLKQSLFAVGGATAAGLGFFGVRERAKLGLRWGSNAVGPGSRVDLTITGTGAADDQLVTVELLLMEGKKRRRLRRERMRLVKGRATLECHLAYPHTELVAGTYRYVARVKSGRWFGRWIESEPVSYDVVPLWFGA